MGRALCCSLYLCPEHCVCMQQVCFAWIILYSLQTAIGETGFLQNCMLVSKGHTLERLSVMSAHVLELFSAWSQLSESLNSQRHTGLYTVTSTNHALIFSSYFKSK